MKDQRSKARVVIGNNERNTVMLDFDLVPLEEVKYWCFRAMRWFKLDGFMILESSMKEKLIKGRYGVILFILEKRSFHAVFGKPVRWDTNVKIMDWVALESGLPQVQKYALMQGIKMSSTLRMSPKGDKPAPFPVFRYGSQDRQIKRYLETRRLVSKICEMKR